MLKIAFVSQPEYFRFTYEDDLGALGEVKEFVFNFSMRDKDLIDVVKYDADIYIFFRGEFFSDNLLKKIRGIKVCLSSEPFPSLVDGKLNYTVDSVMRYKIFRKIKEKSFDYIFHYDQSSLPFLEKDGIKVSGGFPFPVATGIYRKKFLEKKWDFFFIGRSTPRRENFFGALKHKYKFLHICHGVWGEDLVDYANQSKILLNVHAENEISWEPRVQMLMATGNLVISETISRNSLLVPGQDYIEVSTPEEMYMMAVYFLENDSDREQVEKNGLKKVVKELDSKTVFTYLVQGLLAGDFDRVRMLNKNCNITLLHFMAKLKATRKFKNN